MKRNHISKKEHIIIKIIRYFLLIIFCPVVLIYLIKVKINKKKQEKLYAESVKIYDISQINSLSGTDFENYLKLLFEKAGFNVRLTKKSKDFGVDLILERVGERTIVQAKRYSHKVGISAIQEIISARKHYNIDSALVVTNNEFSNEAKILAKENDVMLADKIELQEMVERYPIYFEKESSKYVATTVESIREIETKYPHWI